MSLKRFALSILLVLLVTGQAYALDYRIGVVCFGATPNCPLAAKTAYSASRLLAPQIDLDFKVVSLQEFPLPEAPHPHFEINLFQFLAPLMAKTNRNAPDVLVYASPTQTANAIGVAFVSSFRKFPGTPPIVIHSVGNDQKDAHVLAHEICHTLGAEHDDRGLMTPSISDPKHSGKLSARSLFQIYSFLRFP